MVESSRRETERALDAVQGAGSGTVPASETGRGSLIALPNIAIFRLSFLRFVLLLTGVTAGVVATWNADRHRQVDALQSELGRLERIRSELEIGLASDRRWYDGLERDPRVERELLEQFLGRSEDAGIPLDHWLDGERPDPDS